ncbi:hypothetical protein BJV78DRAFT_495037 [Lactifluus subvellereus]|nr:hypothetical protein BJV78DRAFT_495037 [Lactifluus subvellereus]
MPTPLPFTDSSRNEPQPRHKALNRTSVGLATAVLLCFAIFIVLRLKGHRPAHLSARAQAPTPSSTGRHIGGDTPKLWEVKLNNCASQRPGETVRDWQPIAAWTDENRRTPIPVKDHHVAMEQAWCHDSYPSLPEGTTHLPVPLQPPTPPVVPDPRTLNVAILVAMPSPRPEAHLAPHHHMARTRLSDEDGQLLMGVTSLPCKEQVVPYVRH